MLKKILGVHPVLPQLPLPLPLHHRTTLLLVVLVLLLRDSLPSPLNNNDLRNSRNQEDILDRVLHRKLTLMVMDLRGVSVVLDCKERILVSVVAIRISSVEQEGQWGSRDILTRSLHQAPTGLL